MSENKTGSYSVVQPTIYDYARALISEKERSDALEAQNRALTAELDETKALLAKERVYYEMLSEAVDEFTHTSPLVNGKKVASDLGTVGAKSKECEEAYMTSREWCFKHKLPVYANEPKLSVSEQLYGICMAYPDREQWCMNDSGTRLFPKWACDILDKMYDEDSTFLAEYRTE